MASYSSFSSYFLLLCLSMFLAVSSLGNAMSYGFGFPDDDEPDFYYPQPPPPESEHSGGCRNAHHDDYPQPPPPPPPPESGDDDDDNSECPHVVELISECQEYLNGHNVIPSPTCCDNIGMLSFIGGRSGFENMCGCLVDLKASFDRTRAEIGIFDYCFYATTFLTYRNQKCL